MTRTWLRTKLLPAALATAGLLLAPRLMRGSQAQEGMPHGDLKLDCGECHTAERWVPVEPKKFEHAATGFALEGAHFGTQCRSCHESLVFARVGTACADCHKDAHRGELGFRCETCHTSRTWTNQREMFQVHNRTRFPLLAAHASVDCEACHAGTQPFQYANTPTECVGCHERDFQRTTFPSHVAGGFSRRCEDCHAVTLRAWQGARFSHPASFPLTGPHGSVPCATCHPNGTAGTSRECFACHQQDYNRVSNPNHVAGNFSRQCEECHSSNSWRPATLDHNRTRFPLTGAHAPLDCARCHAGGRYTGTPTNCYACHEPSYRSASNPSHSGFPTTCESCHSTNAWRPANFDHNRTNFPLTGAHRSVDCARCHTGGRYAGTPSDCYACHRGDYDRTNNPNHASAGFPTRCQDCHTTGAWRPASFDHDGRYFPIYSGKHRGQWSSCGDCHVNPGNYRAFECINCHAHTRSEMDREHREVNGYQYASRSCYQCHPRGTEDD